MAKTRDYMDYLDDNIEIAPANSQEEYQAAETIANVLGDHELETTIEEFDTHPMAGMVIPVLTCLLFVCLLVAGLTQDTMHILFVLLSACLVAVPLYVHFMSPDLFDRFGPASQSQNVVALHRATGDKVVKGARPIVVVAHYDTPRESLLRKGPLARYQAMLRVASIPCTIAVAVSLLIQIMLFLPQVIRTFMWVIGLMALVPLLVLAVVDIINHFAVCTTGANDNKSSIAALLAIADKVRPMADRVDEDFEARDPQPHRRRSTDPVPEPPAPRRVEVLEEVMGVRHGADVLNALGILPSTCEVIYQEPRVQVVEEPGAFETDDVAPELPPVDEPVDQPAFEAAPEEPSDEEYSEEAYEEDYDEEGVYADEDDRYEEDYDEEGVYEDADKFADEESDESAESEDEGDSYDETFEGEAYEGEFGEDEESEDYDEEFDEDEESEDYDEEYDEFAEEDYDEEWSESEGAGSVGSWFSERIQDIREFFSKTRGSDIDIDRGEDRRTDEERDEYDEWIDEYSSKPKKKLASDEDEPDDSAEDAYEEEDENAEPEAEADVPEDAESDEYDVEKDAERDDDSVDDYEDESETAERTENLDDEPVEDDQEPEDAVVEESARRAFPNLPHIADGEDEESDEAAETEQQDGLDEEDSSDRGDEFDDFEYDEEELEPEEEFEYDEEDEEDEEDEDVEYEDVAAAPMGIGARIARFFRRLRINPADAEIDPYEEQQRYYEEGYEDEYEEYEEEEYEYEDEPEEAYEPAGEYGDDEFAGSYDEDDLYEPSDFEDEYEDDFEDDFEDDDFEEDDLEPYEELDENPYGESDEDLDDDAYDEVAYIEEDADAEDDEFIEYEEIVEYYEDEEEDEFDDFDDFDDFDEYEEVEEEAVEEEAVIEDDFEDEPYDDGGDFDGNPYYDGFVDADLEFEDELEESAEQVEREREPLSDPNMLHFDREEDDDIVPRDTTGLDTISDSYDLYTGEVNRVADRELPEPLDDPNWGVSSYRPARPVMNIARRAALFDLPDPSAGSVDPFENDYDDYDEYEDDVDGYDDELDEAEASDTAYDEPYEEPYDEPYEEDVAPMPVDDATEEEPTDAPAQRDVEDTLERKGFWNEGRSSNWKGGATVRSDLRDMDDDPLVIDADDLQDAILELGDDFLIGHDIWFVATGASETGHAGIKAFIDAHRRDIRGSFLINLDSIGAGTLSLLVREGLHAQRRADRRLVRMVTDIAKDLHIKLDSAAYTFDERESATSMRSRVRSVTIAGLDDNDLPALSHTPADVPENVDPKQVHDVVRIVTELIRRS